jgi:DNA-binding transcriptional LysR family regulator
MINLHHLRIFYNVARHRSHTRAAKGLCISQPAVTNQLKAFEEKLGLKLLVKKQKSILLTEEGRVLYQYAQKLFDLENEIERVAGDLKGLKIGTVRLGVLRMYSPTFMHVLINQFHKIYPNIMVKVDEAGSLDLIQSLLDFKNEVVICLKAEENSSILFKPFCQEDLVVALPIGHPLAQKKEITVEELADEKIILRARGSASRYFVNQLFEKHNIFPQILTEANNTELIKNIIQKREGISFLSRIAISEEIEKGMLAAVPLEGNPISLVIHIATLKNHTVSAPAQCLLNVLQDLAPCEKPFGSVANLIGALKGEPSGEPVRL